MKPQSIFHAINVSSLNFKAFNVLIYNHLHGKIIFYYFLFIEQSLVQHIEEFISTETLDAIDTLSALPNFEELKVSLTVAKELRDTIAAIEVLAGSEETVAVAEEARIEQAKLENRLQDYLTSVQIHVFDKVVEISPSIDPELVQKVVEVVTQLQEDLKSSTDLSAVKTGMDSVSHTLSVYT